MTLGVIGLALPDEAILSFAGFLTSKNHLHLLPTLLAACTGTISGISISFFVGRKYGSKLIYKFGSYFHITEEKIERSNKWLIKYGNWLFFFGYFIPVVKHLTAITAGSAKVKYSVFALYSYTGGFVWSFTFVLLGYYFGKKWTILVERIHGNILLIILIGLLILIFWIIYKYISFHNKKSYKTKKTIKRNE
jgi:membrane protein DedA with SNARE-associated domain